MAGKTFVGGSLVRSCNRSLRASVHVWICLAFESFATSLSVLLGSILEQIALVFTGLYRVELELGN